MTRFRLSRRMKCVLAGVAFFASVGAVSTKLLGSRFTDFCFCSPPLAQPAFTAPDEHHSDAAIIGGALPAQVIAQRAPLQVDAFNVPSHGTTTFSGTALENRAVAHLGVLWGNDNHFYRGSSSGNGSFMGHGGGVGGGGVMMGGHAHTNAGDSNHTTKPSSSSSRPGAHPSAPPAATAPPAGVILPPTSGTFAGNADPVPGFGTGAAGTTPGTTGVTLGGTPIGGGGGSALSVTPEPATLLLTLTGLFLTLFVLRRERKA